jgi:hypothetical protein
MHGSIVYIAGDRLADIVAKCLTLESLSHNFLFVANVMFGSSHDTLGLLVRVEKRGGVHTASWMPLIVSNIP